MILFLHNRYRTTGGEERAVSDMMWLVREHLSEEAELLERDSAALSRARAAAGLLAGGLAPDNVAAAIATVGPFCVDVASGVERAPGVKDRAKVRAFVERAKRG